ncbi:16S rRNA (guanine(527)-N(7))-methyltransferase RsmG [[Mycoplasma] collis]|uniref:16S rRNA (guanine(527)-N(7))-methyltransferase RsmG n=1 Tax=[Mycoplasma] collis TaxID=2127 RepID=UPI00051B4F37|nr:16S rRNA (guanine(527)-N(7))-methyltransferase RsmG [[Mycoplasma] collis]
MKSFKEKVKNLVNNSQVFEKLEHYVFLIEQENQKINLTGFSGDTLWKEGIYESLIFMNSNSFSMNEKEKLEFLDIGAGAGFPSLPFLIWKNNFNLTIYEPIQKRVNFLNLVKKEINLNFKVKKIRAENSKQHEYFDFITARAVSSLKNLIEISHFLGKENCLFSFLKGPKIHEEIEQSKDIFKKLKIEKFSLFKIESKFEKTNYNFNFIKEAKTPLEYPRKWEKIVKS